MSQKITVRVPATSANCGPGFDSLGLACNLYNYFTYEIISKGFTLEVQGEGAGALQASSHNLAFAAFLKVWNKMTATHIGLKVTMQNNIPLARGLGSSSTAIVAGLIAANKLTGEQLSPEDLVGLATEIEGHPDNVAPAILGGITISYLQAEKAHTLRFLPTQPLKFIAVVPNMPLATSIARKVLPKTVTHSDAVFNTGRSALLIASLLTGDYTHLPVALEDKLHQPYRATLIPGLTAAFSAAQKQGAYNAIISGAGSTLMAYAPLTSDHAAIGASMVTALKNHGVTAVYHILDLDTEGAIIV
ncbi:MAG: homoserine kinase [Acidaminococcaceae bacterium]